MHLPAWSIIAIRHSHHSLTTTLYASSPISNIGSAASQQTTRPLMPTLAQFRPEPSPVLRDYTVQLHTDAPPSPILAGPLLAPTVISAPDKERRLPKPNSDSETSPCAPQRLPTPSQRANRCRGLPCLTSPLLLSPSQFPPDDYGGWEGSPPADRHAYASHAVDVADRRILVQKPHVNSRHTLTQSGRQRNTTRCYSIAEAFWPNEGDAETHYQRETVSYDCALCQRIGARA